MTNVLVGIGMALAMGFSRARIEKGLKQLEVIPGRMRRLVRMTTNMSCDYAYRRVSKSVGITEITCFETHYRCLWMRRLSRPRKRPLMGAGSRKALMKRRDQR